MKITKISATGQIILPPEMRKNYHLEIGTEIILTDTGKGILVQPKPPFPPTTLNEVAGCLRVQTSPKTLEEIEAAISQGIQDIWCDWLQGIPNCRGEKFFAPTARDIICHNLSLSP